MDPNAAYKWMTIHLNAGDYSEAYDMATGLHEWVRKGGFLPGVADATTRVPSAIRRQVLAECWQVIDACRKHIDLFAKYTEV